jgi:hypothetical protein
MYRTLLIYNLHEQYRDPRLDGTNCQEEEEENCSHLGGKVSIFMLRGGINSFYLDLFWCRSSLGPGFVCSKLDEKTLICGRHVAIKDWMPICSSIHGCTGQWRPGLGDRTSI